MQIPLPPPPSPQKKTPKKPNCFFFLAGFINSSDKASLKQVSSESSYKKIEISLVTSLNIILSN